jgi:uncharacterized protein (DUF58 family)
MVTQEVLKKVQRIGIKSRKLSSQLLAGQYHTHFKGRGSVFREVRQYHEGDDIRDLDWNVTARFNHPFIKVYEEEREQSVFFLVDCSQSTFFGSVTSAKIEYIIEICAVLAFSALQNNDKVGAIFFTQKVEKFIPPRKGKTHYFRLIRELLESQYAEPGTSLQNALNFLNPLLKKRSIIFILSDFWDSDYEKELRLAATRHEVIGIRVNDPFEENLPNWGILPLEDPETGKFVWLPSASSKLRKKWKMQYWKQSQETAALFRRQGAALIDISTRSAYMPRLLQFFANPK